MYTNKKLYQLKFRIIFFSVKLELVRNISYTSAKTSRKVIPSFEMPFMHYALEQLARVIGFVQTKNKYRVGLTL